jgi:hypothetical protein
MTRRRAQERGWERACARAEALEVAAELPAARAETRGEVPTGKPARRTPSPALRAHLANVRDRAHAARWRDVDPVSRSAIMSWVVRHRWARTTVAQRRAVGIALARAHWKHPDSAKIAPGGGVYRQRRRRYLVGHMPHRPCGIGFSPSSTLIGPPFRGAKVSKRCPQPGESAKKVDGTRRRGGDSNPHGDENH